MGAAPVSRARGSATTRVGDAATGAGRKRRRAPERYPTLTAVPDTLTISMEPESPAVMFS